VSRLLEIIVYFIVRKKDINKKNGEGKHTKARTRSKEIN
jgi:hypothetical protein